MSTAVRALNGTFGDGDIEMSLSKGKIVLEPVLQHRQRKLLELKLQEWDRYFKSLGLSKLGDLLCTPLLEEIVHEFLENFDFEKKCSSVQGRVIYVCPETFESSLGATFGSDGRGQSGFVPPKRVWDAPREWRNRFFDVGNSQKSQRSDGWLMTALKPEKKQVYQILVRAVLMKCDCTHMSNAFATALVRAEEGGEEHHAVNWAKQCYENFINEMGRIAKKRPTKTVIGQLICKILTHSEFALLPRCLTASFGTQPVTVPMLELSSDPGGDSQSDVNGLLGDMDPVDVDEAGSKRRAGSPVHPERTKKPIFHDHQTCEHSLLERHGAPCSEQVWTSSADTTSSPPCASCGSTISPFHQDHGPMPSTSQFRNIVEETFPSFLPGALSEFASGLAQLENVEGMLEEAPAWLLMHENPPPLSDQTCPSSADPTSSRNSASCSSTFSSVSWDYGSVPSSAGFGDGLLGEIESKLDSRQMPPATLEDQWDPEKLLFSDDQLPPWIRTATPVPSIQQGKPISGEFTYDQIFEQ